MRDLWNRSAPERCDLPSAPCATARARTRNAMVYAVGEGVPHYEIHTPDASSAGQEPGASQRSSSPWTPPAAAQDPWQGAPDPWETPPGLADPYAPDLDAFGKGRASRRVPWSVTTVSGRGTPPECALVFKELAKAVGLSARIATTKTTRQPCAPAREEANTLHRLQKARARATVAKATMARTRALAKAGASPH